MLVIVQIRYHGVDTDTPSQITEIKGILTTDVVDFT